jgi:hypothetical protein
VDGRRTEAAAVVGTEVDDVRVRKPTDVLGTVRSLSGVQRRLKIIGSLTGDYLATLAQIGPAEREKAN